MSKSESESKRGSETLVQRLREEHPTALGHEAADRIVELESAFHEIMAECRRSIKAGAENGRYGYSVGYILGRAGRALEDDS